MTKRKHKNVSNKLKPGTVIKTRDEYLEGSNGYVKEKYKNNNIFYREAILVESNRKNELGLGKIQSSGTIEIMNKAGQIEKFNPRIKTKDDEGNPIKLGKKEAVNYENKNIAKENRKKLRNLKGRKKR